jgi:anti-anti-sigma factor
MEFVSEDKGNYTLVRVLVSRMTALIAPELKAELVVLSSTGNKNILLDISECDYCDSAGINAVLTANRLCKNSNGTFVLGGVNSKVEEILTLTQVDKELHIAYNIRNADQVINKLIAEKE